MTIRIQSAPWLPDGAILIALPAGFGGSEIRTIFPFLGQFGSSPEPGIVPGGRGGRGGGLHGFGVGLGLGVSLIGCCLQRMWTGLVK